MQIKYRSNANNYLNNVFRENKETITAVFTLFYFE